MGLSEAGSFDGLPIVPRQPADWLAGDLMCVLLQRHQVKERIDAVKFAGADQTPVHVADSGAIERFVAEGVFSVIKIIQ